MIELQPKKGAPGGEPEPPNASRSISNFEANADSSAMSNPEEASASNEFTEEAREVAKLHNEAGRAFQDWFQKAIRIGEVLTDVKKSLGHGSWLPWLETNVPFSKRTANQYMRAYQNRDKLEGTSNLSWEDVRRLTASNRKARNDTPQGPNGNNSGAPSSIDQYISRFKQQHERPLNRWIESVPQDQRATVLRTVFGDYISEYSDGALRLESSAVSAPDEPSDQSKAEANPMDCAELCQGDGTTVDPKQEDDRGVDSTADEIGDHGLSREHAKAGESDEIGAPVAMIRVPLYGEPEVVTIMPSDRTSSHGRDT